MSRSYYVKACCVALSAAPIVWATSLATSPPSFGQAPIAAQAQGAQPPAPASGHLRLRGPEIVCDTPDVHACLDALARKHGVPPRQPAGDSPPDPARMR